ncbi:uncharacterized protein LOC144716808 [Wolffia australiana]
MNGCNADGDLDDSEFSRPMPLIGLYIASVSALCAMLMGADLVLALRRRRLWFPCKFFSLNSTTLTLLGIAVKLPVDINTAMPSHWDQLSKLSGAVLVCTAMANTMPSLGSNDAALSDTSALAILVITVTANIITEMATGVVYVFRVEHIIVMSVMIVLLAISISSALFVQTTKNCLGKKYDFIRGEIGDDPDISVECLERCVEKYSLMAYASNSQHVLGRSLTCAAAGGFSLLAAVVFLRIFVITVFRKSDGFCKGESDYQSTTLLVVVCQAVSIIIGTVAPLCRYLLSSRDKKLEGMKLFTVEEYWLGRLKDWRDLPLFKGFHQGSWMPKLAWYGYKWVMNSLIAAQTAVIVLCNFISLPPALVMQLVKASHPIWEDSPGRDLEDSEGRGESRDVGDLSRFVLVLEGEDPLLEPLMRNGRLETQSSFDKGRTRRPEGLLGLLRENCSPGFMRLGELGISSSQETNEDVPEHNSWALPTVALASIVFHLPGIEQRLIKSLLRSVGKSLKYVRLVDKHLDEHGLVNASEAADILWEKLDLFGRWHYKNLKENDGNEGQTGVREILQGLESMGKSCMERELSMRRRERRSCPWDWPPKALAGYYVQRVCCIARQRDSKDLTPEGLFRWLCEAIADVIGACLTNLPRVVLMECMRGKTEYREEGARQAAVLFGEAKEVLRFLRERAEAHGHVYPARDLRYRIDSWASRPYLDMQWNRVDL